MSNPIEKVYKASLKFLLPLSLSEVYKVISDEAVKLLDADFAIINIMENGKFVRHASKTFFKNIKPRKKGYTYKVFKDQKPKVLDIKKIHNIHPELKKIDLKSDLMVPLIYKNKSIGVISVLSKKRTLNKNDANTLLLLTPLASLAIKKAQLTRQLTKALAARDLFISMASHELKTPLTTMYTYLQLIKNKISKEDSFNNEWMDILLNEMTRLNNLVNELLTISRIKSGKIEYRWEEVNVKQVIKRALANFMVKHKERKVLINNKLPKEQKIIADFDKLVEVFINLLDNAAKYSDQEKAIKLFIEKDDKNIVFDVIDSGKGISEEDLPHVFDDFYKGKNTTKPGMGLGLFIIKQIVQEHKGEIKIKSKINEGTTVKVSLPIAKQQ